jgi:ABC-type phosphate/phosphonate transport system permease subunit
MARAGRFLDAFGILVFSFAESQTAKIAVFGSVSTLVLSLPIGFFIEEETGVDRSISFKYWLETVLKRF